MLVSLTVPALAETAPDEAEPETLKIAVLSDIHYMSPTMIADTEDFTTALNSDRKLLMTIIEKFSGGPVGLDTLAAAIGEDAGTIEDVYEPYLLQLGFINRTPRGRCATAGAYRHLGLEAPADVSGGQASFFE